MKHAVLHPQAVIETPRLTLRPLRVSDKGPIELYAGDVRVAQATSSIPHPYPAGLAAAFIDRAEAPDRAEDIWAMDGTQAGLGELIGCIGLRRMDRNQSEIGYWIAPAFWNMGLAREAVRALVLANPQGAQAAFGSVFQDNPASARVLIHAGFEYLGDAEAHCVARDATVATWTYSKRLKD